MGPHTRTVVFTAIDGARLDILVIPVTSMTLDEITPIVAGFAVRPPAMIIEAGGAIARWKNDAWEVEACGPSADTLLDVIAEIEDRTGARLMVDSAKVESASSRRYSEPFAIESGDLVSITKAAAKLGYSIRRERGLFHLRPVRDQGRAFLRLRDELQCTFAIAVGASPIDAELLLHADLPIVMPDADPELLELVPRARIARTGWAAAIDRALRTRTTSTRPAREAALRA